MNSSSYKDLYNIFLKTAISDNDLNSLKTKFANDIKSQRRLDNICSLSDLIHVLAKRYVLNQEDISGFLAIASIVNKPHLNSAIRKYEIGEKQPANLPPLCTEMVNRVNGTKSPKEKAKEIICNELGSNWTDFARALKLPEGKIDDLQKLPRDDLRTEKILLYHETRCDPNRWRSYIEDALFTARRRDIMLSVQNVLDTSYAPF